MCDWITENRRSATASSLSGTSYRVIGNGRKSRSSSYTYKSDNEEFCVSSMTLSIMIHCERNR